MIESKRKKVSAMRKIVPACALLLVAGALIGCDSRSDEAQGGVILTISDFDGLPQIVSVNDAAAIGGVPIEDITIQNLTADPDGVSSDLMSVELDSYRVTYTRLDEGTRTPPTLVRGSFAQVPADGTATIENLIIVGAPQLTNPPLSDLLFESGGIDTETGDEIIIMDLALQFFGETIGGEEVATNVAHFTVEFRR